MILVITAIAFLLGAVAGAVILWRSLPSRSREHIDYKQRWEDAIGLLQSEGKLTEKQFGQLMGTELPEPVTLPQSDIHAASLREIRSMATWDRAKLEIARAEKGLPPFDDLAGMASWDKEKVLEARAAAELRRIKEK